MASEYKDASANVNRAAQVNLPVPPPFPTLENASLPASDGRRYINVLYCEKEQAKRLGAKWDKARVSWYIPAGVDNTPFQRWLGMPQQVDQDSQADFAADLADALRKAGLNVAGAPVMDGSWQRTTVSTSRNAKALKGAYRAVIEDVFKDGISVKFAHGYIQNFDTGYASAWFAKGSSLSPAQRAQFARQAEENRKLREVELAAEREAVAQDVARKWENLPLAQHHPYLQRKGVPAIGLRQDGNRLVTPARDANGKLWSLQYISADPAKPKIFEEGGQKTGHFHLLGDLAGADTVLFAEGYATAASLHLATGLPVLEVFDSGNFDAVMRTMASHLAGRHWLVCGDDDVLSETRILGALKHLLASPLHTQLNLPAAQQTISAAQLQLDGQPQRLNANPDCVLRLQMQRVVQGVPRIVGEIVNEKTQHRANVLINNVGREKALAAVAKHGGSAVFPTFANYAAGLKDFNDLHAREGLQAVQAQVMTAVERLRAAHTQDALAAMGSKRHKSTSQQR